MTHEEPLPFRAVPPSPSSDRAREKGLLDRIRGGEAEGFEHFVRIYQKRIFRLIYTLIRDANEADAITQETFVKAYRGLPDFKGDAAFETWLTRIAINSVRDHARRRKPVVAFADVGRGRDGGEHDSGEMPRHIDPTDGTSPERDLMCREIRRRIGEALTSLSPRQRAVFVMKHYEEKTIAEIGAATGLDDGTIKSHLFRAARKLRARLEDVR